MDNCWRVTAKCGHVGRNHYVPVEFAVRAASAREAAARVRLFPRVKHDHPDAILDVQPVTQEEYFALLDSNNRDGYLHCGSVQEQRAVDGLDERLVIEQRTELPDYRRKVSPVRCLRAALCEEERAAEMRRCLLGYDVLSA